MDRKTTINAKIIVKAGEVTTMDDIVELLNKQFNCEVKYNCSERKGFEINANGFKISGNIEHEAHLIIDSTSQ